EGGELTLSSFDYETSARITVAAAVEEAGAALVSGRLLADISRSLPNHPVVLTAEGSALEIACGSARFTLQLLPVDDYPELPAMPEAAGWITSDVFSKAVSQVVVAAGKDELLPVFTGVRVEIEDNEVSLLATDRYRMALKELAWTPQERQTSAAVLVPGRVLAETAKSMTAGDRVVLAVAAAAAGEGIIGFEGEGHGGLRQITTRLLDGEFPKVRHLMNIPNELVVRVSVTELAAAVKRVSLVAERNTSLRMSIEENQIVLEAATGDQAQAQETVGVVTENPSGGEQALTQAGFNPQYLGDILSVIDAPYAHIAFSGSGKPCLIMGLDEIDGEPKEDYRHVIMLMRLPS
ncbi:MAG: DNA polymerase III subunit beta, partial [Propionibacteriaceae bacterium]|nr:DNA polymerase III subunit beta [Propionibacteriaceae bacterium]